MINQARITELRDDVGDEDFAEVVLLFCEEVEQSLRDLASTNGKDLGERLHFLKGCAVNVGMERLSDQCKAEEERILSDPDTRPDVAALQEIYDASKPLLFS